MTDQRSWNFLSHGSSMHRSRGRAGEPSGHLQSPLGWLWREGAAAGSSWQATGDADPSPAPFFPLFQALGSRGPSQKHLLALGSVASGSCQTPAGAALQPRPILPQLCHGGCCPCTSPAPSAQGWWTPCKLNPTPPTSTPCSCSAAQSSARPASFPTFSSSCG